MVGFWNLEKFTVLINKLEDYSNSNKLIVFLTNWKKKLTATNYKNFKLKNWLVLESDQHTFTPSLFIWVKTWNVYYSLDFN